MIEARVLALFAHRGASDTALPGPQPHAMNFVIEDALGGQGKHGPLLDAHGKTLSYLLLADADAH